MAFTGGYVVVNMAISSGKEPFNGMLCRSRSTQTSNAVGCSRRWAVAVTVSFSQRSEDRSRGFEKTPQRHKDSGSSHRDMVVFLIYVFMQPFNSARSVFGIYRFAVSLVAVDIC